MCLTHNVVRRGPWGALKLVDQEFTIGSMPELFEQGGIDGVTDEQRRTVSKRKQRSAGMETAKSTRLQDR